MLGRVDEPEPGWQPGDQLLVELPDGQIVRCRTINKKQPDTFIPSCRRESAEMGGRDWPFEESSGLMAVCHHIFVEHPGLFGVDIEQGVLDEQLPGRWHPTTRPREVGTYDG